MNWRKLSMILRVVSVLLLMTLLGILITVTYSALQQFFSWDIAVVGLMLALSLILAVVGAILGIFNLLSEIYGNSSDTSRTHFPISRSSGRMSYEFLEGSD